MKKLFKTAAAEIIALTLAVGGVPGVELLRVERVFSKATGKVVPVSNLVYNGADQELAKASGLTEKEKVFYYSEVSVEQPPKPLNPADPKSEWRTSAPKKTNAQTYKVYYVVLDSSKEDDSETEDNEMVSEVESVNATILPCPVSVVDGFTCDGKEYDGNTDAEVKCENPTFKRYSGQDTEQGLFGSDSFSVTAKGKYDQENAGDRTVTISNITFVGRSEKNYTLEQSGSQLKIENVKITKRKGLKIKAEDKDISVGEDAPDLSNPKAGNDYTVTGLVNNDDVNVSLRYQFKGTDIDKPDTKQKSANEYTIVPSVDTLDNYEVPSLESGKLTIYAATCSDLFYYEGSVRKREKTVELASDGKDVAIELQVEGEHLTNYNVKEAIKIDEAGQTDAAECSAGVPESASDNGTIYTVPLTISKTGSGQTVFSVKMIGKTVTLKAVTDDVNAGKHGEVKITPDTKNVGEKITAEYVPKTGDGTGTTIRDGLKWKWSRYSFIKDKGEYDVLDDNVGEEKEYTLTSEDVGKYVAAEAWVEGAECGSVKSAFLGPITDPSSEPETEQETETETETEPDTEEVKDVTIVGADDEVTLETGKTLQLKVETEPTGKTVKWSSSDPSTATVSDAGLVTGVSKGTAFITAAIGDKSDYVRVNVITKTVPVDPKIVMITPTSLELEKGKVGMVVAITNSADTEVTWSSSNERVMKVSGTTGSSYAVVEGVSPGTAELKATCGKDTRSIPVTVTKSDTDDESETEKVTKPQLLYVFPSSVVVPVGDTQELSAMTSPWDSTVMWISEDPTIAKVTGNTVQGVTDGETYITAYCGDDSITIPVAVIGNSSGTSGGVPSTIIPGSVSPSQDKDLAGEPEVYLNQDANTFRIINAYTDGSVSVVVQMTSGIRTVATETVTEADGTVKVVTVEKYTTGNTTTTEETIDAYGENTTSVTTIVDAQGNILEKETRIRTTDTETNNVTEIKETETGAGTVYTKAVTKPNQDVETTIEVRNTSGAVTSKTESNTTTVKGTVTEKIRETTNSATTEITRVSDTYGAGKETKTVKTSDATVTTEADRGAYGQYTDLFRTTVTKAGTRREKYSLQTGAAVLKEISGTGGDIVIPDEMETPGGTNFSVTKIKNGAMNGISVTKLTLGSGLTR
ncbi:MAG: Ig-like domain-containing protein, partial [Lachnospiraceae bacterium]|nr:Ig-like domain-containing protein [Lachnospiraceae bacterium]